MRGDAFKKVSDRNNNILSRAIVYDEGDKQSIEIVMKLFSEEVEHINFFPFFNMNFTYR